MHRCKAWMQCTATMHSHNARIQCTKAMHTCSGWSRCTEAMHESNAQVQHIVMMRGCNAQPQCMGTIHGCNVWSPCMATMHKCNTQMQYMAKMHWCNAQLQYIGATRGHVAHLRHTGVMHAHNALPQCMDSMHGHKAWPAAPLHRASVLQTKGGIVSRFPNFWKTPVTTEHKVTSGLFFPCCTNMQVKLFWKPKAFSFRPKQIFGEEGDTILSSVPAEICGIEKGGTGLEFKYPCSQCCVLICVPRDGRGVKSV